MCRRITCKSCGKPSFAGCGAHIEQVLGDVPPAQRCHCNGEIVGSTARSAGQSPSWWPFGKKPGAKS